MAIRDLPDMYALGLRAYISGKSLMAMLQLLHTPCFSFEVWLQWDRSTVTYMHEQE